MKKHRMLVDVKSYELAEHFMSDVDGHTDADVQELAEAIQVACEDHCREVEVNVKEVEQMIGSEREERRP